MQAAGALSSAAAPMSKNTAQIGCFKILSEASVAAGIRRIEATTGYGVLNLLDDRTAELANTAVAPEGQQHEGCCRPRPSCDR